MIINSIIAGGGGGAQGTAFPIGSSWVGNFSISAFNGAYNASNVRITTVGITAIKSIRILNNADYEFTVHAYRVLGQSDTIQYQGNWNGSIYNSGSGASSTWWDSCDLPTSNSEGVGDSFNRLVFKIILRRKSDPALNISPSEISNVEIMCCP